MKTIRSKLTYANVMSTIAVFLLLGGGAAFAASKLAKNSVGTAQLKNGAVTSSKVKSGSLLASNFAAGQLPAGPQGPKGETGREGGEGEPGQRGVQGERGESGQNGEPGATNIVTRYGNENALPDGAEGSSYAECKMGESVVGGGWDFTAGHPSNQIYSFDGSRPSIKYEDTDLTTYPLPGDGEQATGWVTFFENSTGSTFKFRTYVQCAAP